MLLTSPVLCEFLFVHCIMKAFYESPVALPVEYFMDFVFSERIGRITLS